MSSNVIVRPATCDRMAATSSWSSARGPVRSNACWSKSPCDSNCAATAAMSRASMKLPLAEPTGSRILFWVWMPCNQKVWKFCMNQFGRITFHATPDADQRQLRLAQRQVVGCVGAHRGHQHHLLQPLGPRRVDQRHQQFVLVHVTRRREQERAVDAGRAHRRGLRRSRGRVAPGQPMWPCGSRATHGARARQAGGSVRCPRCRWRRRRGWWGWWPSGFLCSRFRWRSSSGRTSVRTMDISSIFMSNRPDHGSPDQSLSRGRAAAAPPRSAAALGTHRAALSVRQEPGLARGHARPGVRARAHADKRRSN